ncbi:1920_t:CDS:2 [Ambispora leptoticha]|uniref:1920_t:CDS:1 n=1 Tax=Ambispora leptoticha TaxID=144679 RepID=A0A9N8V2S2_9GLOM|nr:1920_t:CDS:2 [Ambispora leptoticha]
MNLIAELQENERQLTNCEIDENEYNIRKQAILKTWLNKPEAVETEPFNAGGMPKETSLYTVLQLEPNATKTEIKSNYKKLALKHHPDKNGGIETEEWNKISKAYKILSDEDKRALYNNYGTIHDSDKASFNVHVGGDFWLPYIGNLEIGHWLASVMVKDGCSSEWETMNSAEQKERRHTTRVSQIVRHLQYKLQQFPNEDHAEFESFKKNLSQEAQKLSAEPNGQNLLSLLGKIYISRAKAHRSGFPMITILNKYNRIVNISSFASGLISGYLKTKGRHSEMDENEMNEIIWQLAKSEISSIAHETCDKVLNEKSSLVNNLSTLGKVWKEVSDRHLQDNLDQLPNNVHFKQNPSSAKFKSFIKYLSQEAQKLSAEPSGQKLLSPTGKIYKSRAEAHRSIFTMPIKLNVSSIVINSISFARGIMLQRFWVMGFTEKLYKV